MLYVQIFIVAFGKRIKIEPTAFFDSRRSQAKKIFQYETAVKESCGIRKALWFFSSVLFCLRSSQRAHEVGASRVRVPRNGTSSLKMIAPSASCRPHDDASIARPDLLGGRMQMKGLVRSTRRSDRPQS